MGQGSSTITETRLNNTTDLNVDQSIRNQINQQCSTSSIQNNLIQLVGSNVRNLQTNQENAITNLCQLQTAINLTKDSETQNDLLNTLSSKLSTEGGLALSGIENKDISDIQNIMRGNLDQSTVNMINKQCLMDQKQSNIIQIFGSDIQGANIDQINNNFVECLMQNEEVTKLTADFKVKSATEKQTESDTKGFNPLRDLSNMLSGIFNIGNNPAVIISSIVILLIICIIASIFLSSGFDSSGSFKPQNLAMNANILKSRIIN